MKTKSIAVVGLTLALSLPVTAATAFRSIELSSADNETVLINMEAEMQMTFSADSIFLSNPEYTMSFGLKDFKGWSFSKTWSSTSFVPVPEKPVFEAEGDGSAETPYNAIAWLEAEDLTTAWITGYIVGSFTGTSIADGANFSQKNHVGSTLLVAPAADITDHELCVGIQLPAGNSLRPDLNLVSNISNLGKEIAIKGTFAQVGGKSGLTNPTLYEWGNIGKEEEVGIDGVEVASPEVALSGDLIQISGLPAGSSVSIVGMDGRIVRSLSGDNAASISLSDLKNGVYILNINDKIAKISVNR